MKSVIAILILSLVLVGCGGSGTSSSAQSPVLATLTVAPSNPAIYIGGTQAFSASGKDQNGNPFSSLPTLTWSSSSAAATINSSGLATGVSAGKTNISASGDGLSSSPVTLTVSKAPSVLATITVSPASASILVGATQTFSAVAKDQYNATMSGITFTWSVQSGTGATIAQTGVATGNAAGSVTIVASASGVTSAPATLTINATPPPPVLTSITVSPASVTVPATTTTQLSATGFDQNGNIISGVTFSWASLNTSAATVNSSGLVTGVAVGTAQVLASADGVNSNPATINVTAAPPVLTTITLSPTDVSINVGGSQQFTATGYDQYNNPMIQQPTFVWSSVADDGSASGLVTVNQSGLATAPVGGSNDDGTLYAHVTASASGIVGQTQVTVSEFYSVNGPWEFVLFGGWGPFTLEVNLTSTSTGATSSTIGSGAALLLETPSSSGKEFPSVWPYSASASGTDNNNQITLSAVDSCGDDSINFTGSVGGQSNGALGITGQFNFYALCLNETGSGPFVATPAYSLANPQTWTLSSGSGNPTALCLVSTIQFPNPPDATFSWNDVTVSSCNLRGTGTFAPSNFRAQKIGNVVKFVSATPGQTSTAVFYGLMAGSNGSLSQITLAGDGGSFSGAQGVMQP